MYLGKFHHDLTVLPHWKSWLDCGESSPNGRNYSDEWIILICPVQSTSEYLLANWFWWDWIGLIFFLAIFGHTLGIWAAYTLEFHEFSSTRRGAAAETRTDDHDDDDVDDDDGGLLMDYQWPLMVINGLWCWWCCWPQGEGNEGSC